MTAPKKVSIMIFHDELCQVFNGLMTALSLQRSGAQATVCFAGMSPACKDVFEFKDDDLIEGVQLANPDTYYTEIVMQTDMNLTF